ncbi:MAG TPA: hypothetical protein VHM31_13040 [Polyangia bacterium]|nr:hypothetical protein [Polyangia bacterium]
MNERWALLMVPLAALACGGGAGPKGPAGGAVAGPADTHCGTGAAAVVGHIGTCVTDAPPASPGLCGVTYEAPGAAPAAADPGDAPADGGGGDDYGATLYNASGDDDDCKYAVSWTSTPIRVGADVTFTVTATRNEDGAPARCASIRPEIFLTTTHGAPAPRAAPVESPAGTYKIGAVKFDAPGLWTVRFHLYESCTEAPDSPHGHAAFFVNVPDPDHPDAGVD